MASDSIEERVVVAFLRACVQDLRSGDLRPLEEYPARFPDTGGRLEQEYEELKASRSKGGSGRRLGPYRLERVLGRGGQGVVWLAEDERLHRTVALKVLTGLFGAESGVPARVAREVEAVSRLDHPGICVVYEAGEADGQAYLAMRYVPGDALAASLEKPLERRYSTALALAEDLARVRRGEPIQARPISLAGRAGRWTRRNPAPAAVLGLLAAGLAATLVVADRLGDMADSERAARVEVQGLLSRSAYEQAQLVSLGGEAGRTWRTLDLLARSREARAGLAKEELSDDVPSLLELRDLAVGALFEPDARLERVLPRPGISTGSFSPDRRHVARLVTSPQTIAERVVVSELSVASRVTDKPLDDWIAFSEGGSLLVAVSGPRTLDLVSLAGPEAAVRTIETPGIVYAAVPTDEAGSSVVAVYRRRELDSESLGILDGRDGRVLIERELGFDYPSNASATLTLNGDAGALTDADRGIRVFRLRDLEERIRIPKADKNFAEALAFLDPTRLVTLARGYDMKVWELVPDRGLDTTLALKLESDVEPRRFDLSQDGTVVAFQLESDLQTLHVIAGVERLRFEAEGNTSVAQTVHVSPSGDRVASVRKDAVILWQVATAAETRLDAPAGAEFLRGAFAADGGFLAVCREGDAYSLRGTSGRHVTLPEGKWHYLAPRAERVFGLPEKDDHEPLTWVEVETGTVRVLEDPFLGAQALVTRAEFSPGGRWLRARLFFTEPQARAPGTPTQNLSCVWRLPQGDLVRWLPDPERTTESRFAFSADGQLAARGLTSGHVRIFDLDTGEELLSLPAHDVEPCNVFFLADGRLATRGPRDGDLRLWDLARLADELDARGLGW